jgi:hypothetical protein
MRRAASGRGFYGASLVLGVLALADLMFFFLPKLQPLTRIIDLINLYFSKINPAFAKIIGDRIVNQAALAILVIWLASYIALEAFSRKEDGVSLWRNIALDSCGMRQQGFRRKLCATIKWIAMLLIAPVLIFLALFERIWFQRRIVTVGFVTVDPIIVVRYIKHIVLGLAMLISIALFLHTSGIT